MAAKKSSQKGAIGTIYDKAKEVVADVLAGAAGGAVIGAVNSAANTVGGDSSTTAKAGRSGKYVAAKPSKTPASNKTSVGKASKSNGKNGKASASKTPKASGGKASAPKASAAKGSTKKISATAGNGAGKSVRPPTKAVAKPASKSRKANSKQAIAKN